MTSSILCPICRTNTVQAPRWSFTDTSVDVPTCGCSAAVSVTMKVSGLIDLEAPVYRVRHSEGLVTL